MKPNDAFKRARFALGAAQRRVTAPWCQRSISPEVATTIFGCAFHSSGWHHIKQTLVEFDENPNLTAMESSLGKFLTHFCPQGIHDFVEDVEAKLPLFVYPWGDFNQGKPFSNKSPITSRFCGPSSEFFIEDEFQKTIALYRKIRSEGYNPERYPNSFIQGTWLKSKKGEERFVVTQGNHRFAILAHLGEKSIKVRVGSASLAEVREDQVSKWVSVVNGLCSEECGLHIFHFFFRSDGSLIKNHVSCRS